MKNIDSFEKLLRLCLTSEEHAFLVKYKVFMQELESGIRKPKTNDQVSFVNSLKSGNQPKNEFEIIWFRYKTLKNYYDEVSTFEAKLQKEISKKRFELEKVREAGVQTQSKLISSLREQLYFEKAHRLSLERKLEELGHSEPVIDLLSSAEKFSYVCNACGSRSPNLCRCSE